MNKEIHCAKCGTTIHENETIIKTNPIYPNQSTHRSCISDGFRPMTAEEFDDHMTRGKKWRERDIEKTTKRIDKYKSWIIKDTKLLERLPKRIESREKTLTKLKQKIIKLKKDLNDHKKTKKARIRIRL